MHYKIYLMKIDLSSAIKKLQRVESIVGPRVEAGGFLLFSGKYLIFEMKSLHFIFAIILGYFL